MRLGADRAADRGQPLNQGRSVMGKPSGPDWVTKFPTSKKLSDLKGAFAGDAAKFIAALQKAGAKVTIEATFRPPERAYLMHYAFLIANGTDPEKVKPMAGVDIDWVHKDAAGKADLKASRKAAQAMTRAFDVVYQPALKSRHTEGLAVDMEISWSGTLKVSAADGKEVTIDSSPRSGANKQLQAVGAGYGVIKLKSDPPHWSSDGH